MAKRTNRTGPGGGAGKGSKAATRREKWKEIFLATLAQSGNVSGAIRAAQVTRDTVYAHRKKDEAFAAGWDQALEEAMDSLEAEAWRRARDGVDIPIMSEGSMCFAAVDPDGKYVPEIPTRKTFGPDGQPVRVPLPGYRLVPLMKRTYSDGLMQLLLQANRPGKYRSNTHITSDGSLGAGEAEQIILVHSAPPAPPAPVPPKAAAAIAAGKAGGK